MSSVTVQDLLDALEEVNKRLREHGPETPKQDLDKILWRINSIFHPGIIPWQDPKKEYLDFRLTDNPWEGIPLHPGLIRCGDEVYLNTREGTSTYRWDEERWTKVGKEASEEADMNDFLKSRGYSASPDQLEAMKEEFENLGPFVDLLRYEARMRHIPSYEGGNWELMQSSNENLPPLFVLSSSDPGPIKLCNTMNYFDEEVTPLAASLALTAVLYNRISWICHDQHHDKATKAFSEMYHKVHALICDHPEHAKLLSFLD